MNFHTLLSKPIFLIAITACIIIQACKKTEFENAKRPYNEIERFTLAGYGEMDTLIGVITGDSIVVFWDITAQRPSKIKPIIDVSDNAVVTPASGKEVNFSEGTVFTVTAEDGSVRQYKLVPKFIQAIPLLSSISPGNSYWIDTKSINITGQYFLAGGDTSKIHVYAQRRKDGFEFDMPITRSSTTQTNITANFPEYSSELDTGAHRIWVKIGDVISDAIDTWIGQPRFDDSQSSFDLVEDGKPVHSGDVLTINYSIADNYGGSISKFYKAKAKAINLELSDNGLYTTAYLAIPEFSMTDNQIKIKLPDEANEYINGFIIMKIEIDFPFQFAPNVPGTDYGYVTCKTNTTFIKAK